MWFPSEIFGSLLRDEPEIPSQPLRNVKRNGLDREKRFWLFGIWRFARAGGCTDKTKDASAHGRRRAIAGKAILHPRRGGGVAWRVRGYVYELLHPLC